MVVTQNDREKKPKRVGTLRRKWRHRDEPAEDGRTRIAPVYDAALLLNALAELLKKFDPRVQIRNPVMFVVWLGAVVTAALTVEPALFGPSSGSRGYNGAVTVILLLTVWFANFAEALAEGRGKAKAASLRKAKIELMANRVWTGKSSGCRRRPCAKTIWSASKKARAFRPMARSSKAWPMSMSPPSPASRRRC